ncbi:Zinc finger transcription factor 1 [Pleurostoma richardsiae]|uniref:Zinc finger transcription factor 1 n=1 Tax=Pleurostoma richardsiae TaxID=41990 RepID=A0AA38SAW7_9PEZI|nr:Zinc finger transcription factor 1 [Pleurostoma richardsiae]
MSRTFSRTPQACGLCRRRKTKCDGIRPRCGHCRSKNLSCFWSAPGAPYDAGVLTSELLGTVQQTAASPSPSASTPELEPQGLQLCLDLFFERHFASDFCSFDHRPDFEQKCRQDPLLSSSVVSLCGRYVQPQDAQTLFGLSSSHEVSRHYTHRARSLAKMASDEPSVSHIQANLILAMAELLSNSGSRHWLFAGTAIRMAEIMRLNKEFHQKHSLKEQEIRRRTFWACLLFDRALAYLLAKHRTINLENVSITVPGTDLSLIYQEETRGLTLSSLADYRRPSDLGLSPYLIKTVCVWSEMADFAMYSRRHQDAYPPTDSRSMFFIRNAALQAWIDSLPPSLLWSAQSYKNQCVLGQGRPFVAMQLLLRSASCVAHQCYLPHLTIYTKLVNLVDAAGLSYLHREQTVIEACVANAFKFGEMLDHLMSPEQGDDKSLLQTIWVASSVLIVANTFLWLQYAEDDICMGQGVRQKAEHYFDLVHQLVSSWVSDWKAAGQWLVALNVMHDLYKAAYLGEVDEKILSQDSREPGHEDDDSASDFRPQPGDGYPSLISLPNLQASVKFATCDTSARSISLKSIWLQLSGGWPCGFTEPEGLIGSLGGDDTDFDVLVRHTWSSGSMY